VKRFVEVVVIVLGLTNVIELRKLALDTDYRDEAGRRGSVVHEATEVLDELIKYTTEPERCLPDPCQLVGEVGTMSYDGVQHTLGVVFVQNCTLSGVFRRLIDLSRYS